MKYSRKMSALSLAILSALSLPVFAADTTADNNVKTKDVVVTATRTEEEVKNVPNTVEVITSEDFKRLGATDVYSALRLANNIDVTSAGMAGHNVMIRGMDTNHSLILIDGKRFAGEDTGETQNVYALDRVSLSNIERIEIVRGAASAQYGSDALGGVINIITKKSGVQPSVTVGASTGTDAINNYYHIDFGKNGKLSSSMNMRFTKNRKIQGTDGTNYYGPVQDFNFSGTYDVGKDNHVNLDLGYYNEHTKANYADGTFTNLAAQFSGGSDYITNKNKVEWYDYKRYDASLSYDGKTHNGDYLIRAFYSRLEKNNHLFNFRPDLPEILNSTEDIYNAVYKMMVGMGLPPFMAAQKAQAATDKIIKAPIANIPSDKLAPKYDWDTMTYNLWGIEGKKSQALNDQHLLTYGAEYRSNRIGGTRMGEGGDNIHQESQTGNGVTITKDSSERTLNTYAAYLQDEWMPSDKWLIIPSVRYDHDGNFGGKTTPKIGATYFINNHARVKANWGKGFKAPTVSELYMNMHRAMGLMMVNVYGNPNLKPEESTYWDVSLEGEKGKTWGKLTYFNNDVDNLIESETIANRPGTYGVSGRYINVGKASIDGVELTLGHKFNDNWSVKVNSNWLDAMNEIKNTRLNNRAKNTTTLQVNYDDNNPYGWSSILWWQLANNYSYLVSSDGGNSTTTKNTTYGTLNFTVTKKLGEDRNIFAGLDNILNKKIDDIGLVGRIWRVGAEWKI